MCVKQRPVSHSLNSVLIANPVRSLFVMLIEKIIVGRQGYMISEMNDLLCLLVSLFPFSCSDILGEFMEGRGAVSPGILTLTTGLSKPFMRLDKYPTLLKELERHMEVCI